MTVSPTQPNLSNLQGAALVAVPILRANKKSILPIMTVSPTQTNLSNLQGAALVAVRILRANKKSILHSQLADGHKGRALQWIFEDEP